MAKSRRRRDTTDIAKRSLPVDQIIQPIPYQPNLYSDWRTPAAPVTEDRRQWHPEEKYRGVGSTPTPKSGHATSIRKPVTRGAMSSYLQKLANPARAASVVFDDAGVCAKRQARREVLHAFGKAGRGGQKRPRRTVYSNIKCRRK